MIITGMDHFQSVCKRKLVEWYHKNRPEVDIDMSNVFVAGLARLYRITNALHLLQSVVMVFTLSILLTEISRRCMRMFTANSPTPVSHRNKED